MNELRDKWLEALRSNKYIQGKGWLKTGYGTYCCLGVAAEVCLGGVKNARHEDNDEELLSPESLEALGITDKQQRTLAEMNDLDVSFTDLADYIEGEIYGKG